MKCPSIHVRQRGVTDVKMTPMIDVVFLLLIFFVWTASFQIVEYVLPTELSADSGTGRSSPSVPKPDWDFDPVLVRIVWRNQAPGWMVNDTDVRSLVDVRSTLAAVARVKHDLPVIVDPEPVVPFGHVIDVYDIAQLTGFQKIQFASSDME